MKKFLVIIVIAAMVLITLSGCGKNDSIGDKPILDIKSTVQPDTRNTHEPSSDAKPDDALTEVPKPDINVIESGGDMRIIMPRAEWNNFTEDDTEQWEDYIKDKYKFDIDIITINKNHDMSMTSYIAAVREEANKGGFVYTPDLATMNSLIDSRLIESVNQYMGKIDRYNTLPDNIVQQLSDIGGNMWGFPLSDNLSSITHRRYYSVKWLESAEMDVPETVEEFYEFAMFVAQTDLDGNGLYDSYAAEYTDSGWLNDFNDIFKAFGCYSYGQSPVAYNPQKGKFENCIFSENFTEAITFIKLMYEKGVLFNRRPESMTGGQEVTREDYQIAATSWLSNDDLLAGGMAIGNYLTGINEDDICENRYYGSSFTVLKGTPDAAEKINAFINLLMSDPNSRMDFSFGVEDVHYEEEEDYFNFNTKDESGNYNFKRMDIHIRLSDMGFSEKYSVSDGEDYRKDNEEFYAMMERALEDVDEIDESVKYSIPLEIYDERLDSLRTKTYRPTRDLFKSILAGNIELETAIEAYRMKLSGLKVFDTIDSMNMDLLGN